MPRQRIGGSKRSPGDVKIGKATRQRSFTPPQSPPVSVRYVPDAQEDGARPGTQSGTQSGGTGRQWKPVPQEPLYMAEGGVIGAINTVGDSSQKAIEYLQKIAEAAEMVAWLIGDHDNTASLPERAKKTIGSVLDRVRGR